MAGENPSVQDSVLFGRDSKTPQTSKEMVNAKEPEAVPVPAEEAEYKPGTSILEAQKIIDALDKKIAEHRDVLAQIDIRRADDILRGRTEAGQVVTKRVETDAEYAQRILKGEVQK